MSPAIYMFYPDLPVPKVLSEVRINSLTLGQPRSRRINIINIDIKLV